MTTVNLSVVLAAAGWKITVIDGDLGLASVKLMVPLSSTAHLGQWFLGRCKYHQLTSNTPYGFNVISAPQNEFQLQDLSDLHHVRLAKLFNMIQSTSDLLIIDNGAGISKNVMGWCHMAHRLLLVTTPDPTAIMSAYATIKAYTRDLLPQSIGIIVNQARSQAEALDTYKRLNEVISNYLYIEAQMLGYFRTCPNFRNAIRIKVPPVIMQSDKPFGRSVFKCASRVSRWLVDEDLPAIQEKSSFLVKKVLSDLDTMEPVIQ